MQLSNALFAALGGGTETRSAFEHRWLAHTFGQSSAMDTASVGLTTKLRVRLAGGPHRRALTGASPRPDKGGR
jgi:hypothetical protein